jgi:hypothetical protein
MHENYRFHIQPLVGGGETFFQLTMGMAEEQEADLIPVCRTAFAQRLVVQEFHTTEVDVQVELTALLDWLDGRGQH